LEKKPVEKKSSKDRYVTHGKHGWDVKAHSHGGETQSFATKHEAESYAREAVKETGGEVILPDEGRSKLD
jgi:Uncharacterized protein conserved in bacteria (DUF2188)